MDFHKADMAEIYRLRNIAYQSVAHWGYDASFMDIFEERFNITREFLQHNPVYAGTIGNEIVGCWGMQDVDTDCPELEYFYIASEYLNRGLGKRMWLNLTAWCKDNGVAAFGFVTSPQAVGFYEKMGAAVVGERCSSIDGRMIPLLEYRQRLIQSD